MLQVTNLYQSAGPLVVRLGRGARRGCGLVVAHDRVAVLTRSLARETVEVGIGGDVREAAVLAGDVRSGLSLLEAPTGDVAAARFSQDAVEVGQPVLALGDPGSGLRATEGRVSAGIEIRSRTGRSLAAVEHTAPMPRGTGGGPLLDEAGAVIGINVLRGDPGFVIALASAVVEPAVQRLLSGEPQPARLGVAVAPPHVARRMRRAVGLGERDGVLVREVEQGSPAEIAGLRAGDLIVGLGGGAVRSIDDLHAALESAEAGATIDVLRGADELGLALDLGRGVA